MQNKTLKLVVLFLFSLGLTSIQAQEAISASGGNATGSGSASYTVGQVVYTTTNSGASVSQGVQQPYEISVVTGIEVAQDISLEVSVYPNPAQDYVILKIKKYEVENLGYQLYDINGSMIRDRKVEGNETTIEMQNLKPSVYFFKVTDNHKTIKSFKIIKH